MPSPRRRPKAQRSDPGYPTVDQFLAGAPVTFADWPFPARVLLSKALLRRESGMLASAATEFRSALAVATNTTEAAS